MNLPEEFWEARLADVPENVREHLQRYLRQLGAGEGPALSLVVSGPEGVGKTSIAAVAAKVARSFGHTVYFTSVWDLREGLRARATFDEDRSLMDRCREVDVLVLDGLRMSDSTQTSYLSPRDLEELVRDRSQRGLRTVITSQSDLGKLRVSALGRVLSFLDGYAAYLYPEGVNRRAERQAAIQKLIYGK